MKSGCLEDISRNVEEMIKLRTNGTWEGSYTGRIPVHGLNFLRNRRRGYLKHWCISIHFCEDDGGNFRWLVVRLREGVYETTL